MTTLAGAASAALFLQQAGGGSIWPHTVGGWLTLTIAVLTIAGVIGGVLARWLGRHLTDVRKDIDGTGKRIDSCERGYSKLDGRVDRIERDLDRASFERTNANERIGELHAMVESLAKTVDTHRQTNEREIRAIRESVTAIQTTVDVFREAKQDILQLVSQFVGQQQQKGNTP